MRYALGQLRSAHQPRRVLSCDVFSDAELKECPQCGQLSSHRSFSQPTIIEPTDEFTNYLVIHLIECHSLLSGWSQKVAELLDIAAVIPDRGGRAIPLVLQIMNKLF